MRFSKDIDDTLLDALSAQFEHRTPIQRDDALAPTETAAEHVARAIGALIDDEIRAAKLLAADQAIAAAEKAGDDQALQSALLSRHKVDAAR